MATNTTPETINGKTTRLTFGIHNTLMDAIPVICADPTNPLLPAWNSLAEQTRELIEFQATQIRFLEALCRNTQGKADTVAARVYPDRWADQ